MFGTVDRPVSGGYLVSSLLHCCISREFQVLEATEIDNQWYPPINAFSGGSHVTHYPGGLQVQVRYSTAVVAGMELTFRCNGDELFVNHGGVTGGSGNFEIGETITSTSGGSGTIHLVPSSTQVKIVAVTGSFNDTDTLTQTTGSGGTATQSGASTGLSADKTVRFRFINSFGVPATLCTLTSGSATGGSATVVGNEVQNVTADPTIVYTVTWNFAANGISNATRLNVQAEIERP